MYSQLNTIFQQQQQQQQAAAVAHAVSNGIRDGKSLFSSIVIRDGKSLNSST
jgi:hypothetical protein